MEPNVSTPEAEHVNEHKDETWSEHGGAPVRPEMVPEAGVSKVQEDGTSKKEAVAGDVKGTSDAAPKVKVPSAGEPTPTPSPSPVRESLNPPVKPVVVAPVAVVSAPVAAAPTQSAGVSVQKILLGVAIVGFLVFVVYKNFPVLQQLVQHLLGH